MTSVIVHSDEPIALFGGGEADHGAVALTTSLASTFVAADSGANLALKHNIVPDAVIGDFDSISSETKSAIPDEDLFHVDEQDSTDFDKALRSISAPLVLAVGFTGARIDHQLAAMTTLAAHPDKRCVIIGEREFVFLCPSNISMDLPIGSVFSLYPLGRVCGTSVGLKWPIDGVEFPPDARIGTSNEVVGPLRLQMDHARMLVIVPRTSFDKVISSLMASGSQWPARAR